MSELPVVLQEQQRVLAGADKNVEIRRHAGQKAQHTGNRRRFATRDGLWQGGTGEPLGQWIHVKGLLLGER